MANGIGSTVIVGMTWYASTVPSSWRTSAAIASAAGVRADRSLRVIVPATLAVVVADGAATVSVTPLVGPPVITGVGAKVWSVLDPSITVACAA
jgi:hypothetical protein